MLISPVLPPLCQIPLSMLTNNLKQPHSRDALPPQWTHLSLTTLLCLSVPALDLQVPLSMLTDNLKQRLKSDMWGNVIFWLSFCVVGQVRPPGGQGQGREGAGAGAGRGEVDASQVRSLGGVGWGG